MSASRELSCEVRPDSPVFPDRVPVEGLEGRLREAGLQALLIDVTCILGAASATGLDLPEGHTRPGVQSLELVDIPADSGGRGRDFQVGTVLDVLPPMADLRIPGARVEDGPPVPLHVDPIDPFELIDCGIANGTRPSTGQPPANPSMTKVGPASGVSPQEAYWAPGAQDWLLKGGGIPTALDRLNQDRSPGEDEIQLLEARLYRAIERLEQAAQGLPAWPVEGLGTPPRAFRGRIDP